MYNGNKKGVINFFILFLHILWEWATFTSETDGALKKKYLFRPFNYKMQGDSPWNDH